MRECNLCKLQLGPLELGEGASIQSYIQLELGEGASSLISSLPAGPG